jgi:manganese-dependent inorganic pyrophosphatase
MAQRYKSKIYLLLVICITVLTWFPLGASAAVYFIGHLNPDTDSIVSAIAAARFFGGVAARTGELNQESQYLLKKSHFPVPVLLQDFAGKEIGLVDFNQTSQAPAAAKSENIVMIIDHHALGESPFVFARPIMITIKPWGSTAAVLAEMFFRHRKPINKDLATLLLGGIVSDTLAFHSPTTTGHDRQLGQALQKIAGIADVGAFVREMFAAKSDITAVSVQQILLGDYKVCTIKGQKIGIAVAETIAPGQILEHKERLLQLMADQKIKDNLKLMYFMLVDLRKGNSTILLLGKEESSIAARAFQEKPQQHLMLLPHLVSRKKQFIPLLNNAL